MHKSRYMRTILTEYAEWTDVMIFPIVQKIIARASNRVIVGLPHCKSLLDMPRAALCH